jgi:hypothetical protein
MGSHLFRNPASRDGFFDRQGLLMVTPRAMNYYLQDYKKWLETQTAGQLEDYSLSNVHK